MSRPSRLLQTMSLSILLFHVGAATAAEDSLAAIASERPARVSISIDPFAYEFSLKAFPDSIRFGIGVDTVLTRPRHDVAITLGAKVAVGLHDVISDVDYEKQAELWPRASVVVAVPKSSVDLFLRFGPDLRLTWFGVTTVGQLWWAMGIKGGVGFAVRFSRHVGLSFYGNFGIGNTIKSSQQYETLEVGSALLVRM